jgi:hypothetical protein
VLPFLCHGPLTVLPLRLPSLHTSTSQPSNGALSCFLVGLSESSSSRCQTSTQVPVRDTLLRIILQLIYLSIYIKGYPFSLPMSDSTSSRPSTPTFSPVKIYFPSSVSISAYNPRCREFDPHTKQIPAFRAPSVRGQSTLRPSPFTIKY